MPVSVAIAALLGSAPATTKSDHDGQLWTDLFLSKAVSTGPTPSRNRAQPYLRERTRAFTGVNLPVARHLDLEVGNLDECPPRPAGERDNHALAMTLSLRL